MMIESASRFVSFARSHTELRSLRGGERSAGRTRHDARSSFAHYASARALAFAPPSGSTER